MRPLQVVVVAHVRVGHDALNDEVEAVSGEGGGDHDQPGKMKELKSIKIAILSLTVWQNIPNKQEKTARKKCKKKTPAL